MIVIIIAIIIITITHLTSTIIPFSILLGSSHSILQPHDNFHFHFTDEEPETQGYLNVLPNKVNVLPSQFEKNMAFVAPKFLPGEEGMALERAPQPFTSVPCLDCVPEIILNSPWGNDPQSLWSCNSLPQCDFAIVATFPGKFNFQQLFFESGKSLENSVAVLEMREVRVLW